MSISLRTFLVALVVLFAVTVTVGCGSSTSTSPAEAEAVSVAEMNFLKQWRAAVAAGDARCSGKGAPANARCYRVVVVPLQGDAMAAFSESIESLLDGGVGPECAEALEDTRSAMNSVPSFPGEASAVCRAESRQ